VIVAVDASVESLRRLRHLVAFEVQKVVEVDVGEFVAAEPVVAQL